MLPRILSFEPTSALFTAEAIDPSADGCIVLRMAFLVRHACLASPMRLRRRFLMPTCTVLAACANGRVRDAVVAHGTNKTDAPLRRVRFVMCIPYISIAFTFWSVRNQRMVAAHSEHRGERAWRSFIRVHRQA